MMGGETPPDPPIPQERSDDHPDFPLAAAGLRRLWMLRAIYALTGARVAAWVIAIVFILAGGPLVESTRGKLGFTAPLAAITAAVQATDSSRRMATNSSEKASIFSGWPAQISPLLSTTWPAPRTAASLPQGSPAQKPSISGSDRPCVGSSRMSSFGASASPIAVAASGGRDHYTAALWPLALRDDLRAWLEAGGGF